MDFLQTSTLEEKLELIQTLAGPFSERAAANDLKGRFAFENIQDLKETGYTKLTVPQNYGGGGISLYELVRLQEAIAVADGSTALSIGWHMGIFMHLSETRTWNGQLFERICRAAAGEAALINTCATEVQTGSPTRGGMPENNGNGKERRMGIKREKNICHHVSGARLFYHYRNDSGKRSGWQFCRSAGYGRPFRHRNMGQHCFKGNRQP